MIPGLLSLAGPPVPGSFGPVPLVRFLVPPVPISSHPVPAYLDEALTMA